jgi:hypothetical protein
VADLMRILRRESKIMRCSGLIYTDTSIGGSFIY